jgi:hypothetical protein
MVNQAGIRLERKSLTHREIGELISSQTIFKTVLHHLYC